MAAAPPAPRGNNRVHLYRLLTLTIDEGTSIVRNIFDDKRPNGSLDVFLAHERKTINQLRNRNIINRFQYDVLFPASGTPTTANFELALTICLLRNLQPFGLNPHFAWNAKPLPEDTSLEADLLRLRITRYENISVTTDISQTVFEIRWREIENVLLRLNASLQNPDIHLQQRIADCKKIPLDLEAISTDDIAKAAPHVQRVKNRAHLFRLLTLTIDEGISIVRNIFDDKRPNISLDVFLATERYAINQLIQRNTINQSQYNLLFPQIGTPTTADFDLTLTICLLRNLKPFGLNPHFAWNAKPLPGDTSLEADLFRLRITRYELWNKASTTDISEIAFQLKWSEIENVLLRLNTSLQNPIPNLQQRIDECKNKPLDPGKNEQIEESEQADTLRKDAHNIPDEIENDPYYLKLYNDAISKGEEKDRVIRVNVVGNFAQGKTTLIKRLTHQPIKDVESTNSIEINHCKYKFTQDKLNINTKEHVDKDDDVTGRVARVAQYSVILKEKPKKRKLQQTEIHSATIPSVSERETNLDYDEKTDERTTKQQFEIENDETIEITVDQNLDSSIYSREQIREEKAYVSEFDQKKFALHLQKSQHIDTHENDLDIWDFGGQFSFYATHSLFHSRRAVYLLVFDLSIPLCDTVKDSEFPNGNDEKTMEEYAKFWLNSIHAYVGSEDGKEPPVILVGTHKDKLKGNEVAQIECVHKYFVQIRKLFKDRNIKCHIQPTYFAVDNTDVKDHAIINLRKEVIQQGEKLAKESIPAKWIPLEKALKIKRNTRIMSFEDVMNIDSQNKFPLEEEEQVQLFLRYHHFKGTLLFFDEEPVSAYVVLDPQYLIDAFKCIISSKRFSDQDLWERLTEEALLETDLLDSLWNIENGFSEHKNVLLMFLEKHLIISEISAFDEESRKLHGLGEYLVPSLLPRNSSETHLIAFLNGRRQTSVRYVMSFYRSAVVQLVFYRLLAALIGKWPIVQIPTPEQKTLIYENKGVFRLDKNHAGIVEYTDHEIDLRVLSLLPSCKVASKCADELRRFSESIVQNEFMKFRNSMTQQDKPYKTCFKCNNEIHGAGGGINSESLEDIRDKQKLPCPDLTQHEICPAQILSEWFLTDKIDVSFPDRQINDKELSDIAKAIGKNWRLLGLELGLTNAKLDQIEEDNKTSIMRRYAMLLEWKRQKEDRATIKHLIYVMETETNDCIEWDDIRNFVDKIKSNYN